MVPWDHARHRHQFDLDLVSRHHPERTHGHALLRRILFRILQLLGGRGQQRNLRRRALVLPATLQSFVIWDRLINAGQVRGCRRGGGHYANGGDDG
jgi:hypothetical protein